MAKVAARRTPGKRGRRRLHEIGRREAPSVKPAWTARSASSRVVPIRVGRDPAEPDGGPELGHPRPEPLRHRRRRTRTTPSRPRRRGSGPTSSRSPRTMWKSGAVGLVGPPLIDGLVDQRQPRTGQARVDVCPALHEPDERPEDRWRPEAWYWSRPSAIWRRPSVGRPSALVAAPSRHVPSARQIGRSLASATRSAAVGASRGRAPARGARDAGTRSGTGRRRASTGGRARSRSRSRGRPARRPDPGSPGARGRTPTSSGTTPARRARAGTAAADRRGSRTPAIASSR